jgi:hypothetical protein
LFARSGNLASRVGDFARLIALISGCIAHADAFIDDVTTSIGRITAFTNDFDSHVSGRVLDAHAAGVVSGVHPLYTRLSEAKEITMRTVHGTVLEALLGAQRFMDSNAPLIDEINKSNARQNLDAAAAKLGEFGALQAQQTRESSGETARQRSLVREVRRTYLQPIQAVARRVLRTQPEFKGLKLPGAGAGILKVVAGAKGMANAAAVHERALIDAGLPPTFLADLRAVIAALEASLINRNEFMSARRGTTEGLAEEEKNGRVILNVLDAQIEAKLGETHPLFAEWKSARGIRRIRRTPAATSTTSTTSTTATAPTVATPVLPPGATPNPPPTPQPAA